MGHPTDPRRYDHITYIQLIDRFRASEEAIVLKDIPRRGTALHLRQNFYSFRARLIEHIEQMQTPDGEYSPPDPSFTFVTDFAEPIAFGILNDISVVITPPDNSIPKPSADDPAGLTFRLGRYQENPLARYLNNWSEEEKIKAIQREQTDARPTQNPPRAYPFQEPPSTDENNG